MSGDRENNSWTSLAIIIKNKLVRFSGVGRVSVFEKCLACKLLRMGRIGKMKMRNSPWGTQSERCMQLGMMILGGASELSEQATSIWQVTNKCLYSPRAKKILCMPVVDYIMSNNDCDIDRAPNKSHKAAVRGHREERPASQRPRFIHWPGNFILLYPVEPVQPLLLLHKPNIDLL